MERFLDFTGLESNSLLMEIPYYPQPLNRRLVRLRPRLVNLVIERDKRFCRLCGADEDSICPYSHEFVTLTVAMILPRKYGGRVFPDNLKTFCTSCAEGLAGLQDEAPSQSKGEELAIYTTPVT